MKLNSKKIIAILALVTVTVAFFLNLEKEVKEGQIVYSNTEPEIIIEVTEEQAKVVILNQFPFDGESVDEDPEKRKIVPYTKALPPMPTEDEAKYGFPDVNKNKVRDDVEIGIVEAFEDDAMLVEAFFAAHRTTEYDIYLAKNSLLTRDNLTQSAKDLSYKTRCASLFYNSHYANESRWNTRDMYNRHVYSKSRNTEEKKELLLSVDKASHGMVIPGGQKTTAECISFFEATLDLPIGG